MTRRRIYRWGLILAGIVVLAGVIQIGRSFFIEEERATRIRLREAILDEYPEKTEALNAKYGLKPFGSGERGPGLKDAVVLVHGIDEPGKVWRNLAPELVEAGHGVWILTYPNDQPIPESARLFLEELASSPLASAPRIAVVTHSMGGLVTREMLTDPAMAYLEQVRTGRLPQVDRFIMVGTPNHGSELARFRGFLEIRDQLSSLSNGDYHWLSGFVDGAGEAGIDLIPDSAFMQRLNGRPHPDGVEMLVIAGVMSPNQRTEIEELAKELKTRLPAAAREISRTLAEGLTELSEMVGDGAVSVESARLPDVPLVTVPGTHLSIIRNVKADSPRTPPAIPLILEKLEQATPETSKVD